MEFEQVAPRRAEAPDGTIVELVDRYHAQLHGPRGTWLVELGPGQAEDWLEVTVFADSLLRAGGEPDEHAYDRALDAIVTGLRSLRVRVAVERALADGEVIRTVHPPDDETE